MAISLREFYENTVNTRVSTPIGTFSGHCASLVQQYLYQCFDIPFAERGNAKDFIKSLPNAGLAKVVNGTPQIGDIVVCPNKGIIDGVAYGHIGIFVGDFFEGSNMMYEQNFSRYTGESESAAKTARISRTFKSFIEGDSNYAILRITRSLILEDQEETPEETLNGINLRAVTTPIKIKSKPVTGTQVASVLVDRQAKILSYLSGFKSDGYQWAYVDYNGTKGYAPLNLKESSKIVKNSSATTSYLKAVNDKFCVRTTPVTGSIITKVPTGSKAKILSFESNHASDGYQWAKVDYNGAVGYAQMDTEGYYQLTNKKVI